jgi:hypothetical protein
MELSPLSLDEMLQTQSFFAIGSVIAMPKAQMTEPVLEPEIFLACDRRHSQRRCGRHRRQRRDELGHCACTGISRTAGRPAGGAMAAPAPSADPEPSRITAKDGAPAFRKPGAILQSAPKPGAIVPRAQMKAPPTDELRQQAQVLAPKALQDAVRDSGVKLDPEALRSARVSADQALRANTGNAQTIGDAIARKVTDSDAPIPKALQVRSRLDVDVAVPLRERAGKQLEALGLSGIVTPGEGGQMRITIGVNPTQFRPGNLNLGKVEAMRALFAPAEEIDSVRRMRGHAGPQKIKTIPVLATECVVKVLHESGDYRVRGEGLHLHQPDAEEADTAQSARRRCLERAERSAVRPAVEFQAPMAAPAGQSAGGAGFNGFWTKTKDKGSRDVVVAVVDTGLQMNHPDIKGSPNLAPGYDMVSDPMMGNDGDGRDNDPNDPGDKCDAASTTTFDTFHGTHVAGTIGVASTNNAAGVAGGNWDVTIVPVRALGRCGGKLSDINDAIRWAAGTIPARDTQGARCGIRNRPTSSTCRSVCSNRALPRCSRRSTTQRRRGRDRRRCGRQCARRRTQYFAPGGCHNVISVAANDARGVLTPYSNYGAKVSIMAPGGDMSRDDDKRRTTGRRAVDQVLEELHRSGEPGHERGAVLLFVRERDLDGCAARFGRAGADQGEISDGGAIGPAGRSCCRQPWRARKCSVRASARLTPATPIAGSPDMCYPAMRGKMLSLSNAQASSRRSYGRGLPQSRYRTARCRLLACPGEERKGRMVGDAHISESPAIDALAPAGVTHGDLRQRLKSAAPAAGAIGIISAIVVGALVATSPPGGEAPPAGEPPPSARQRHAADLARKRLGAV